MKKLSLILSVILVFLSVFLPVSASEPYINAEIEAQNVTMTDVTPTIDGVISPPLEYDLERKRTSLTYSKNKEQFNTPDDHDEYDDWDFDFYIKWDKKNVYMAWVVKTDVHKPLPESEIVPEWNLSDGEAYLGNMWKHSFVHILITPGAPLAGKTKYKNDNYLELGVCQLENGSTGKAIWNLPKGLDNEDVSSDDWSAAVSRNDERGETIYEVSIPWIMMGIAKVDSDDRFGLAFAVGAQENYDEKKGIIEWNDAILGTKAPDNAGVVHLSKVYVDPMPYPMPTPNLGEIPDEAEGKIQIGIDHINEYINGEDTALKTDPTSPINTNWAHAMLLKPIDGKDNVYTLIDTAHGSGKEVEFDRYEEGMLILGLHSDCQDPAQAELYAGYAEKAAAMSIPVGSELTLWGVDVEKGEFIYDNAIIYVSRLAGEPDTSDSTESSVADVSNDPSNSKADDIASNVTDSEKSDNNENNSKIIFIVIAALIVVVAAVVIILTVRAKKEQQ